MRRIGRFFLIAMCFVTLLCLAACGGDDDDNDDGAPADDDTVDDDDDSGGDDDDNDTAAPGLQVGAARVDISPQQSVMMGGYGTYFFSEALCRWSEGVHDPIYATALALDDGVAPPVIFIVVDAVGIITTDVVVIQERLAAQLGIAPERIVLAATHDHQSPDTVGIWGVMLPPVTGRDDYFINLMIDGAVEAGAAAYAARRPAVAAVAKGQFDDYHYNAQWEVDPDAPLDSTLTVLSFTEPDGAPIATLANWGCHPMVMGPQNNQISADFVGPYYRVMDEEIGGVNLFANGNLGAGVHPQNDEHPINYENGRTWGSWTLVEYFGRGLAQAARALLAEAVPLEDTSIDLVTKTVYGQLRNPFFAAAGRLELIPRDIPAVNGWGETTMTAWRLGPVLFATAPGEISPRVGLRLRYAMGGDYQVIANIGQDWLGYFMMPDEYQSLLYFYFSILSVGPDMGTRLIDAYQEVFAEFP